MKRANAIGTAREDLQQEETGGRWVEWGLEVWGRVGRGEGAVDGVGRERGVDGESLGEWGALTFE
jgi:hypothetical protein